MKTPSTALFRLIRKMSPSEKRYFKRFGLLQQKKDSNKYTLLFDAINAQDEYDEGAILEEFKDYDFVNNFSEIKKYLFNQIQKALRNYHSKNSINIILYNYLSDISVLYGKELYKECNKLIRKAKKIAKKHEKWSILLLLNEWKRNVFRISHHVKGIEQYLEEDAPADKQYIHYIVNEQQYFNKSLERVLHLRKNGPDVAMDSKLETPSEDPLTFRSKRYLLLEQSMLGYVDYDVDKIYNASKKDVELFENNRHFIKAMPKQYVIALANMQDSCKDPKYNHAFDKYMNKALKVLKKHSFDPEFQIKETFLIYILKCTIYNQRANIPNLKKARKELKKQMTMTRKKGFLDVDLEFYAHYYLLRSAVVVEDYTDALENYNDFLQLNLSDYRSDLQMETRVLGLIPHYESENWMLLESLVRSAYRLLQRKHKHFVIGKLFIKAIKKCVAIRQKEKEADKQIAEELKELRQEIVEQTDKKRQDFYFVFLGWIDSKITDKTIAEAIFDNIGCSPAE